MSATASSASTVSRLASSSSSSSINHHHQHLLHTSTRERNRDYSSTAPFVPGPATVDSHRPKTAPSAHPSKSPTPTTTTTTSSSTATPDPPIPKIAIFADALSLKKLREQYQTIRKSPTLPDLSHSHAHAKAHSTTQRPQTRRVNSATAASTRNNYTNNVTADPASAPLSTITNTTITTTTTTTPQQQRLSPQLPELNFDSRASSAAASSFSASRRAPPASHSSNGIDTGKGPPPALVTRSASFTSPLPSSSPSDAAAADAFRPIPGSFDADYPFSPTAGSGGFEHSLDAIMDRESTYSDAQEYLDERASKYHHDRLSVEQNGSGAATEGSGRSTEDLFLNLAHDSSALPTRTSGDLERRLSSRGRSTAQRSAIPTTTTTSLSKSRRDSIGSIDLGTTRSSLPTTERSYSGQRRASTTSTPPLSGTLLRHPSSLPPDNRFNMYRNRYMASSNTPSTRRASVVADSSSVYSRPPSYRPSKLNQLTRDFDSVSMVESPLDHRTFALRSEHHDAAESVVSGAPSTVWDELQELKSRIQQIELHDKIISTGSNGSNERPKTATTATTPLTTMSSSPKYQFKSGRSPQDSVIGGHAAVNAYPVLHQTLARCKDALTPPVYRALELATSDALELALLTGNGSAGGNGAASVVNGGFTSERQLKRKADNVVRNLQDLCVELCKLNPVERVESSSRPGTSNGLPSSSHGISAAPNNRNSVARAASRASSAEPSMAATSDTTRAVPSRALDRIEARRASLMLGSATPSATNSPREASDVFSRNSLQLPSSVETTPSAPKISQLPRSGTSLLRSRRAQTEEPEDDDTNDASPRPVSRAATEIGVLRKRQNRLSGSYALNRTSREYTSSVPLPLQLQQQPASSPIASTPPTSSSLRRLNGTSLKNESPRSTSLASSLLREPRRAMTTLEKEKTPEPAAEVGGQNSLAVEEESGGAGRRLLRRSLGMYTSSARASLGLGLGKRGAGGGGERRGVLASGGGGSGTGE